MIRKREKLIFIPMTKEIFVRIQNWKLENRRRIERIVQNEIFRLEKFVFPKTCWHSWNKKKKKKRKLSSIRKPVFSSWKIKSSNILIMESLESNVRLRLLCSLFKGINEYAEMVSWERIYRSYRGTNKERRWKKFLFHDWIIPMLD